MILYFESIKGKRQWQKGEFLTSCCLGLLRSGSGAVETDDFIIRKNDGTIVEGHSTS